MHFSAHKKIVYTDHIGEFSIVFLTVLRIRVSKGVAGPFAMLSRYGGKIFSVFVGISRTVDQCQILNGYGRFAPSTNHVTFLLLFSVISTLANKNWHSFDDTAVKSAFTLSTYSFVCFYPKQNKTKNTEFNWSDSILAIVRAWLRELYWDWLRMNTHISMWNTDRNDAILFSASLFECLKLFSHYTLVLL